MTGQELIDEIREHLDEPSAKASYFTDTRILSLINRVYRRFVRKTGCIVKMTNYVDSTTAYQNEVASVANSPRHALPSDFMCIHHKYGVYWSSDGRELTGRNLLEMQRDTGEWNGVNVSGTPSVYSIEDINADMKTDFTSDRYMLTYPYPAAVGHYLQCYYIPKPTAITTATSPLIHEDFEDFLIYECAAIFKVKREKYDSATELFGMAKTIFDDAKSYYERKDRETRRQIPKSMATPNRGYSETISTP